MKFVTFYIDLIIKTIFLVFLGYSIYSGILANSWFEEVVTQKCMGTDVSFYPDFENYKLFHKRIQIILLYIAMPILVILLCDTVYLSFRKQVKEQKTLKIRKKRRGKHKTKEDILKEIRRRDEIYLVIFIFKLDKFLARTVEEKGYYQSQAGKGQKEVLGAR